MKKRIKQLLAKCGLSLHRLPEGIPTGDDFERDLRLIFGSKTSSCCIDAGANDGSTIALIRRCLPAPVIHSFEPNPTTFAVLTQNHSATPNIHLVNAGLGATTGSLTLHRVANHALNSFLPMSADGQARLDSPDAADPIEVPVFRLDDYLQRENIKSLDLLKIDTQGFELHVLKGAEQLLVRNAVYAVLVELNFADLYVGQAAATDVIALLANRGLRLVDFYEKCRHGNVLGWCTALFVRSNLERRK